MSRRSVCTDHILTTLRALSHRISRPISRRVHRIGLLVAIVLMAGIGPASAQDQEAQHTDLDEAPRIVGGEEALYNALEYPAAAREENIEGTVVVRFLVMPDGSAKAVGVEQSVHPLLDREAERVIEHVMFTPGWKDGKAVLTAMTMPVRFDLDAPSSGSPAADTPAPSPESSVPDERVPDERVPELIGGLDALRKEVNYPRKARRKGIEGRVFVRFVVSKNGLPTDVRVVEPVHPLLDEEAVRAVRELRFLPGIKDGDPVAVQMTIPISFGRK